MIAILWGRQCLFYLSTYFDHFDVLTVPESFLDVLPIVFILAMLTAAVANQLLSGGAKLYLLLLQTVARKRMTPLEWQNKFPIAPHNDWCSILTRQNYE